MGLKDRIENSIVVILLGVALAAFGIGFGAHKTLSGSNWFRQEVAVSSDLDKLKIVTEDMTVSELNILLEMPGSVNHYHALAAVFDRNTSIRLPNQERWQAYQALSNKGFVLFNTDVSVINNLLRNHGFKIDDSSMVDHTAYTSNVEIDRELAEKIQSLNVRLTKLGVRTKLEICDELARVLSAE